MDEPTPQPEPQGQNVHLQIQVPDDLIRGRLADVVLVGSCEKPLGREFRLLFYEVRTTFEADRTLVPDPHLLPGTVHAPVVLYPENAKRLAGALAQNVARFMARFGATHLPPGEATPPLWTGNQALKDLFDTQIASGPAAVYANFIMVNHRPSEFTLDFLFVPPNPPFARVVQRVILAPGVAVALAADLERAVAEFERRFGPIQLTPFAGGPIVH